jgi:hypothetical protein
VLIKKTARRDGQNKGGLGKMKHRKFSFSALAIALLFGFVLAGCGNKDPLEGKWTTSVEGETVTLVFYGGQAGINIGGNTIGSGMMPYTFEKNAGTIGSDYIEAPFTLDGKTIKVTVLGRDFAFARAATPATPKALAGEWIADDGDGLKMVFISDMVILTYEDGDAEFGWYTFADNQGEISGTPFIVNKKTLTIDPEDERYKKVFTLGGKK